MTSSKAKGQTNPHAWNETIQQLAGLLPSSGVEKVSARPFTVEDLADIMRGDTLNPIAAGFTLEDLAHHLLTHPATGPLLNSALLAQSKTPGLVEEDRIAVDQFAAAMKLKLSQKSKKGRQGWKEASAEYLSRLLREHIHKGDPVDVANFAMMLHQNGQSITPDCKL